jgi:hypothetical protein
MSTVAAQNILQKLRSSGIKVYLKNGAPHFSTLDNVPGEMKKNIMEYGRFILYLLKQEEKIREARLAMKKPDSRKKKPAIPDIPATEL